LQPVGLLRRAKFMGSEFIAGTSTAAGTDGGHVKASAFVRNVAALLERIEYRRCEAGEDIEEIYRLRYRSYLAAGMIRPEASRKVSDDYDDLPNSYRFGLFFDGYLVSTLRLHHVTNECPISPSVGAFREIIARRVSAGETFVDPSRFAADLEWSATIRVLPYLTLRLAVAACEYFDPDYCLTAVKQEHTGFYHRIFNSVQAAPHRLYPGLTCPVFLFESKCSENLQATLRRFPFFKSTPMEQRMLFAKPNKGELAPLVVLPTVKYMRDAA
jgi:hypothetical protein